MDAEIAAAATRFGKLSEKKLSDAIDTHINRYDPDAVRRFKSAERGLDVRFGRPDDETGTRSIYGRVKISDAELMDRRADALARSVCPDDPRTHGERRTEASASSRSTATGCRADAVNRTARPPGQTRAPSTW